MSITKVYPWWQVASDICGYDDAALEKLMESPNEDDDPLQAAARTDIATDVHSALLNGSLPAYRSDGRVIPIKDLEAAAPMLKGVCVEPKSVNELLKSQHHLDVWTPEKSQELVGDCQGISRQRQQEIKILELLRRKGYDPQSLPKNPQGKDGVKLEIRIALGKRGMWSGRTVFDKAWQRLRDIGEIVDK